MKQAEALETVLACAGKPQQVRAVVNALVRERIDELRGQRNPRSKDAWRSIEKEALDLGRWLSGRVGQEFNERIPRAMIARFSCTAARLLARP